MNSTIDYLRPNSSEFVNFYNDLNDIRFDKDFDDRNWWVDTYCVKQYESQVTGIMWEITSAIDEAL